MSHVFEIIAAVLTVSLSLCVSARADGPSKEIPQAIHAEYVKTVKPILEKKCFSCHDGTSKLFLGGFGGSWNPLAKEQLLARSIVNMARDLGSERELPKEGILPLVKIVADSGAMPPADYTRFHGDAKLTAADRAAIAKWVADAAALTSRPPQAVTEPTAPKPALDAASPNSASKEAPAAPSGQTSAKGAR